MTDDELLVLMKRVDPQAVRLPPGIKAIAAEIEAVEREACAKVCDNYNDGRHANMADVCSDEIRKRSNGVFSGTPSGVPAGKQG